MDINTNTEAGQIAGLTKAALQNVSATVVATPEGQQFLVVPKDHNHFDITPENGRKTLAPDHTRQAVTLQTLASLTAYGIKFKTPTTTLFADVDSNTIVAALDYHGPDKAQLVAHVAEVVLPFSMEWVLWNDIDNKMMDQLTFARFIEENAYDIISPIGADLLEAVKDMQSIQGAEFKGRVKTESDNVNFDYSENTQTGSARGDLSVPKQFILNIPVYFGDSPTPLTANLRHRVENGKLLLGIALHRKEHVRQDQFQQHLLTAQAAIDCLAVFGRFEPSR
ncbi:DUF2303 family protein [Caulobacter sp.]|uniref:DUF2303 family protein n=1 Tax=Caulobacter sp. TaxID=78 RepID=UPI003BB079B1